MNELMKFMSECMDSYRSMQKMMKHNGQVTPKQYGEYLQKNKKSKKRKR